LNLNFVLGLAGVLMGGAKTLVRVDIGQTGKGMELEWWIVRGSLRMQLLFVVLTIHSPRRVMGAKR